MQFISTNDAFHHLLNLLRLTKDKQLIIDMFETQNIELINGDKWNALPVKSDRVFKRQCKQADVIFKEDVEKIILGKRVCHMVAFDLKKLANYGLYTSAPAEVV